MFAEWPSETSHPVCRPRNPAGVSRRDDDNGFAAPGLKTQTCLQCANAAPSARSSLPETGTASRSSAARLTERPPPQCNMGPRRGSFPRCRGPLRRLGPLRASKRRRRSWFSELLVPCARTVSPPSAASFLCVFSFPARARRARRDKERPCFLWPARTWVVCFLPGGPERAR